MTNNTSITDCKSANTQRVHWIEAAELLDGEEVACPPLDACLWDSHPRVFLKISEKGEAYCPYCSTIYRLHGGS